MNWTTATRHISAYLDDRRPRNGATSEPSDTLRGELRSLPSRQTPPELGAALRSIAQQERTRRMARSGRFRSWITRSTIHLNDLMRPLAIPATGGLLSTVLCFAGLVSNFATGERVLNYDVPVALTSGIQAKSLVPMGFSNGEVIVNLVVDEQGRMVGYSVANDKGCLCNEALRIKNTQLMPSLSQPMSSEVSISFKPIAMRL